MRINFRQGVVSYQLGGFLNLNGSGNVDILASVKPTTVTIAHKQTDYQHSEDNTVVDAWSGPFINSVNYWLYWDFNLLTFNRTFNQTTLEPVAQSVEPGLGDADIIGVTPGAAGIASFVVDGHYIQTVGKVLAVVDSTLNDGNYTVSSSTYNSGTGETVIGVDEEVLDATVDGRIAIDIDYLGDALKINGRIWYNTSTNIHYILSGNVWTEILIVFAGLLTNGNNFVSVSINGNSDFTGTQIGDVSSVLTGRVLFSEAGDVIARDNGTFFTTEDQFFSSASRVDGIRIESNVSRAQFVQSAAIAAFTPVAFVAEGKIEVGQYDDTGQTVIGMLMEDLLSGAVGAVVIQGVITNPAWSWPAVGVPLWVENGTLTSTDPHISDPITYPHSKVPIARVLSSDSIVFEQGLGGIGERGPSGSVDDLPAATTTDIGSVRLSDTPDDPLFPTVITTTDISVTNARIPLPHIHTATDISFTPGSGIGSANVQLAIEELGNEKVNIVGDTLTGFLTLHSKPTNEFHAVTKNYVDQLVLGLIWLDPIDLLNMISDSVTAQPVAPEVGDAYVIPPGATGGWSVIAAGNIAHWDGHVWQDLGAVTAVNVSGARFGISFTSGTSASGSFVGQDNNIAQFDATGTITGFEVPTDTNAVYVSNAVSAHAYNQYAFGGTSWVLMGGGNPITVDDTTIELTGNILNVKQASDGGTVDSATWNGLSTPTDLGVNLQILQTDGAGNTDWVDASSGGGGLDLCDTNVPLNQHILMYSEYSFCWEKTFPNFLRSDDNESHIKLEQSLINSGSTISISTGDGTWADAAGGLLLITAGLSDSNGGNGGAIVIEAGQSLNTGDGGNLELRSGRTSPDNIGDGGDITMEAGYSSGSGNGGNVNITAGRGNIGNGGSVNIAAGWSGGGINDAGGDITITAGHHYGGGGNILLQSGEGVDDTATTGGNITLLADNLGGEGKYSRASGGILLRTSDGTTGGDTIAGRGVIVNLGQSYPSDTPQHLHIISPDGLGQEGISLHKGTDTDSNAVTIVAGETLTQNYVLKMPPTEPAESHTTNVMLTFNDDQGAFSLIPYDISATGMGPLSDGEYFHYGIAARDFKLKDGDTTHKVFVRTPPGVGGAWFEIGTISSNNTEQTLGSFGLAEGSHETSAATGLEGDVITKGTMWYAKCVTANGVGDVTIGIRGFTVDLDTVFTLPS